MSISRKTSPADRIRRRGTRRALSCVHAPPIPTARVRREALPRPLAWASLCSAACASSRGFVAFATRVRFGTPSRLGSYASASSRLAGEPSRRSPSLRGPLRRASVRLGGPGRGRSDHRAALGDGAPLARPPAARPVGRSFARIRVRALARGVGEGGWPRRSISRTPGSERRTRNFGDSGQPPPSE